ncbi:MAG: glycosyltransferase family 39 protein [Chloroflexota bacterium]
MNSEPMSANKDELAVKPRSQGIFPISATTWLIISGLLMSVIFHMAFATRYSLSNDADKPLQSIATLNNFSADGAFLYVAGFAALFGLYWLAMRYGMRPPTQTQWLLVGVFALSFNILLLPMYPADAADIYDYILRGRMSATYKLNPMVDTPNEIATDPFYDFAAPTWHNSPSAYGPAWEMLAAVGSRITGDENIPNVIIFKLISVIGYALTALFIGLTLRFVAPRRALVGVTLFAWNPLVVYMTAGTGHNDAVMTACIALSIYCLMRRWYVGSTVAAVLGALVKFIPILLVPIIAIVALRQLRGSTRLRYLALSALLCTVLVVSIYGPFWNGMSTLGIDRRTGLYTGSVETLARQTLGPLLDGQIGSPSQTPNTNQVITLAVLVLFGAFYVNQLWRIYSASLAADPVYPVRTIAYVLLFYLLVTCTWFQPWYVLWVVPLAALLDNTPLRRLIVYYSYFATWQSFLYNYVTLRPSGFAPLPWRDLLPIAVVQFTAWACVIFNIFSTWARRTTRKPLTIAVGTRLSEGRKAAHLTLTQVADRLNWRTDDLLAYERGERAMPIDRAWDIEQVLDLERGQLLKGL